MHLRVLGAHNMETRTTRMESHLVDSVLALDAGSLTRALTLDEQIAIRAILLSHRHYDHVKDLLPLGMAVRGRKPAPIDIYAIPDAIDAVSDTLMNGRLFPDFTVSPSADAPTFRFHPVGFYEPFDVLGYTVTALPVPHSVPAAGFQIVSADVSLFYTGDTGRGVSDSWEHIAPDVLLTEVTFGNGNAVAARESGHLTPALLADALHAFRRQHDRIPRVLVSHINPPWEAAVRSELAELTNTTGISFTITEPDMTFDLRSG